MSEAIDEVLAGMQAAGLKKWADRIERALSAQGEAVAWEVRSKEGKPWVRCTESVYRDHVRRVGAEHARALYTHPAPAQDAHPDDLAVDRFAAAMKEKLAAARAKGRGGWDDKEDLECHLSNLLRAHVEKGDPRDVANFCCFLWNRGESIQPAPARVTGASYSASDVETVARKMFESEQRNRRGEWTWEECSSIEREGWTELALAAIEILQPAALEADKC